MIKKLLIIKEFFMITIEKETRLKKNLKVEKTSLDIYLIISVLDV
jgi:hypothetical protein